MSIVPCQRARPKSQAGFTLVELAIVMIIIGLLIGGVLKGQQLITNAQIAATVAQIKAIDASMTSFRDQYAGVPGDLLTPNTRLSNCAAAPCNYAGNGDGRVGTASITFNAAVGALPGAGITGEMVAFWAQLNSAGLLTGINPGVAGWGNYAPASKIAGGGFEAGWNAGGTLFPVQSGGVAANVLAGTYLALHGTANAAMAANTTDGFLKPNYAARIDTKIDDGEPFTGTVLAGGVAAGAAGCATGAGVYNESIAGTGCSLYIQFQN